MDNNFSYAGRLDAAEDGLAELIELVITLEGRVSELEEKNG